VTNAPVFQSGTQKKPGKRSKNSSSKPNASMVKTGMGEVEKGRAGRIPPQKKKTGVKFIRRALNPTLLKVKHSKTKSNGSESLGKRSEKRVTETQKSLQKCEFSDGPERGKEIGTTAKKKSVMGSLLQEIGKNGPLTVDAARVMTFKGKNIYRTIRKRSRAERVLALKTSHSRGHKRKGLHRLS